MDVEHQVLREIAARAPRAFILTSAIGLTMKSRNREYGDATTNFRFMSEMMAVFDKYYIRDNHTPEHHEAMRMALFKVMRIANGVFKEDNYMDAINYLAIAAECDMRCMTNAQEEGRARG